MLIPTAPFRLQYLILLKPLYLILRNIIKTPIKKKNKNDISFHVLHTWTKFQQPRDTNTKVTGIDLKLKHNN